jgi:hypothetical protein
MLLTCRFENGFGPNSTHAVSSEPPNNQKIEPIQDTNNSDSNMNRRTSVMERTKLFLCAAGISIAFGEQLRPAPSSPPPKSCFARRGHQRANQHYEATHQSIRELNCTASKINFHHLL